MDDRLAVLEKEYAQLAGKIDSLQKRGGPKKDLWDIVSATTPLITGILISGIGLYFAYTNNEAQLKLQETQTIEKFIPHLIGSEPEKKAAIIALSTITNTETAAKYAELFPSEGTASALKSIATSTNAKDSDKRVANRALANTFHQMADTYQATQNKPAAEQAYEQSIGAQEKLVGKSSPELMDTLTQLTATYKADGKYALAEATLKRMLKIQESVNGSRSPQFIDTLHKLAQVSKLEGKTDTANHLNDYADLLAKQLVTNIPAKDSSPPSTDLSTVSETPQQNDPATTTASTNSTTESVPAEDIPADDIPQKTAKTNSTNSNM